MATVQTTPATPAGTPVIQYGYDPAWFPSPTQAQSNWVKELTLITPQAGLL